MNLKHITLGLSLLAFITRGAMADSLGTAFTYQGQLSSGGQAANGPYDLQFKLYDSAVASTGQVGPTLTTNAVAVLNGLFTVRLDFGDGIFTGPARWLDIAVRTNGAAAFTSLSPRQQLSASPYALYTPNAGLAATATTANSVAANSVDTAALQNGAVTSAKIGGGNVVKTLNLLKDDITLAPGANMTLTPNGQTLTLASPTDWHVAGNAGTTPGADFLGTTDNQPLELKVNGQRALRLEPTADTPNVVGGSGLNAVTGGSTGATIAGGGGGTDPFTGPNQVNSPFGTIGGGSANRILGYAAYGTIAGGLTNLMQGSSYYGTISGGTGNSIIGNSFGVTLSGGAYNSIGSADYATVGGGAYSAIGDLAHHAVLAGGYFNAISPGASNAVVSGGYYNTNAAPSGVVSGGANNALYSGALSSTISGGIQNVVQSNILYSVIGGGMDNQILAFPGHAARLDVVGGGQANVLEAYTYRSVIGGGYGNRIQFDGDNGVIVGGYLNLIGTNADSSAIGGGSGNFISNSAQYATIPGGNLNSVSGSYGFAAGRQAKAAHSGAFVWADNQAADFSSTANNQFLVRAQGGVGINRNNPATALDVNGTVTATAFNGSFSGSGSGLTGISTASIADNSITAPKLANDANSLAKVTAGNLTASSTSVSLTVNEYLNDKDIFLRGDTFHGLGWYGAGKLFANRNVNGPALYGADEGVLGTIASATQQWALAWNKYANVTVHAGLSLDNGNANTGSVTTASLTFGAASGEGIASKRSAGGNQYGLDFYTGSNPRLSIDSAGRVGIGTTAPSDSTLDVRGDIRLNDCQLLLRGGTDRNHGLCWKQSVAGLSFDGAFVYGYQGGALGTVSPDKVSLKWDWSGNVWISNGLDVASLNLRGGTLAVDTAGLNNGSVSGGITFGSGGTGEGIASKRTSGGNQNGLDLYTSYTSRMSIANNGNVGIGRQPTANRLEVAGNASKDTAGSWLANSDARIKTDVQTITGALDTLDKVRLVSFRYTDDYRREHPRVEPHRYVNVVAQEFREVFPDDVKSSGERLPDGSEILQVDTYPLTIYSAAAVQELDHKVEQQARALKAKEDEIQVLQQRLGELEKVVANLAGRK